MFKQKLYLAHIGEIKKIENILENDFSMPEFQETDNGIGHWECHGQVGFDTQPALEIVEESIFFLFPNEYRTLPEFMEVIDDNLEYYTKWQNHSTEHAGVDYHLQYEVTPLGKSTKEREGGFLLEIYWTED